MHRFDLSRRGRWRWLTIALTLLCFLMAACSDDDDPAPMEPDDDDDVEIITETFEGTLTLDETSCHDFLLNEAGDITMVITDIEPLATLTLGLGIGLPAADDSAEECVFIAEDQSVRRLEALLTSNRPALEHCVCAFDVGNIFPDVTIEYTLDVSHP